MMRATRVIAIRHGETAWNSESRIQGQTDIGLNAAGAWQASRLPAALADEGIEALYSSDLRRTLDTAGPLAAACGLPVVADAGLRERCFGAFEGHTFAEIEARWPAQSERWRRRDADFGPAGGEVLADFYARSVAAATRLVAAHPGQAVALVTHGGVLDCLYRAATRIDLQAPRSWQIGNAGIHRLLYSEEGFVLVGWNDLGHLEVVGDAGSEAG
jgi:probable phosphoglycerate mutase